MSALTGGDEGGPGEFREHDLIAGWDSFQSRNGLTPRLFVLHTSENASGQNIIDYVRNNGGSYHYVVNDDGEVFDLVHTDDAAWSVLDPANNFTINLCFDPAFAGWRRRDWLDKMRSGISVAARVCARDCQRYGIPPTIRVGSGPGGYCTLATNDGVTDHYGIVVGLHIGDHTDVGPDFPWDIFDHELQSCY